MMSSSVLFLIAMKQFLPRLGNTLERSPCMGTKTGFIPQKQTLAVSLYISNHFTVHFSIFTFIQEIKYTLQVSYIIFLNTEGFSPLWFV